MQKFINISFVILLLIIIGMGYQSRNIAGETKRLQQSLESIRSSYSKLAEYSKRLEFISRGISQDKDRLSADNRRLDAEIKRLSKNQSANQGGINELKQLIIKGRKLTESLAE